jgi:catechol 2,3-dioxygenase-like lactoylglutathione lyase family enzyme
MFSHVMLGTNDIERARRFYDAVFKLLGAGDAVENTNRTGQRRLFYRHEGATFCLSEPLDGQPASVGNGSTLGFKCDSAELVSQFQDVAVAAGGSSNEEPPGPRAGPSGVLHLAYVRDPDGHKLCALHRPRS